MNYTASNKRNVAVSLKAYGEVENLHWSDNEASVELVPLRYVPIPVVKANSWSDDPQRTRGYKISGNTIAQAASLTVRTMNSLQKYISRTLEICTLGLG